MKTRIIWTRIWEDEWFDLLSQEARWLFIYLLTNTAIGLSGCFELRDKTICYHTHLTKAQLLKSKNELSPKVKFVNNWIGVLNAQGYNGFTGESNEIALKKELLLIPKDVKDILFSVKEYTPPTVGGDSPESLLIINHNLNNNNKYKNISDIKEKEIKEVAEKYKVSTKFVESVLEDLENDIEAKGKDKYANKLAALRTWVKNQIKWDSEKGKKNLLKDLEPNQILDIRTNPEKLLFYQRRGYDISRMRTR